MSTIKMSGLNIKPKLKKIVPTAIVVIFALVMLFNSFYVLQSGEEAVICRFGAYSHTDSQAGIRFKVPFVDSVTKENVSSVRRYEFGYVTEASKTNNITYTDSEDDVMMLTSDECLVNVECSAQYMISDLYTYLFKTERPDETFAILVKTALRRAIANHTLDESMTDNKSAVQQEIFDDLQEMCKEYKLGLTVINVQLQDVNPPEEVQSAFKDVASAREDKSTYINEANSYANKIIPIARGNAQSVTNAADAYAQTKVATAEGDVAAFLALYEQFSQYEDLMRTRMYLETIEEVLGGTTIYIMDESSSNVNTLLPLQSILGDK
ncbi:MAG: FtsH protease activity modulator HflK [Clostridia bacterium]|nr:FtsH protease activity modulator HflK [Clostridia bacterium]